MDETHERTDENEEQEFADIHRYLTEGIYRDDCTANEKRILRRKANRYREFTISFIYK